MTALVVRLSDAVLDTERICGMSVPELKSALTARELDTDGLKAALMARLEEHEAPRRGTRGEKRPAPFRLAMPRQRSGYSAPSASAV